MVLRWSGLIGMIRHETLRKEPRQGTMVTMIWLLCLGWDPEMIGTVISIALS